MSGTDNQAHDDDGEDGTGNGAHCDDSYRAGGGYGTGANDDEATPRHKVLDDRAGDHLRTSDSAFLFRSFACRRVCRWHHPRPASAPSKGCQAPRPHPERSPPRPAYCIRCKWSSGF